MDPNVLAALARGVPFNALTSFSEGLDAGRKRAEQLRVRDAMIRAGNALGAGQYGPAANALVQGDQADAGIKLMTASDPRLNQADVRMFQPQVFYDKNGNPHVMQGSTAGGPLREAAAPEGYYPAPTWGTAELPQGVLPYNRRGPAPPGASAPAAGGDQPGLAAGPGTPGMIKKDYIGPEADKQRGEIQGKTQAEAQRDLPGAQNRLDYTVSAVDNLLAMPGLNRQTGIKGRFLGWLNPQERIDFEAQAQKVNGQTLMSQLDMLKALRPVSNEESKNVANAAVNLDAWQNPELYAKGLKFYKEFLTKNFDVLAAQARGPAIQQNPVNTGKGEVGGGGASNMVDTFEAIPEGRRFRDPADGKVYRKVNGQKVPE